MTVASPYAVFRAADEPWLSETPPRRPNPRRHTTRVTKAAVQPPPWERLIQGELFAGGLLP
ncbi:hypothetical protein FQK07_02915 [Synechococcus sp. BSF8S]|uniref:hypothetical protein n=1 Tax=Synechococcales TaxID=1890424 RepID=UPI001627FE4B|nr:MULTISPECIES: hypothetical protein [unclassified Synechococcus]MBC1260230.1 hypothetical protein [Synechococcus sp. BSF8S]MBC1262953.1 hypothetical protein [Synechococcus sp. BSA11S]